MTDAERFFREIVDIHVVIERWVTGRRAPLTWHNYSNASRLSSV
jgi:hypothetical protein